MKALDDGIVGQYWTSREAQQLLQTSAAAAKQSTPVCGTSTAEDKASGDASEACKRDKPKMDQDRAGEDHEQPNGGSAYATMAEAFPRSIDMASRGAGTGLQSNMELTAEMLPPDVYGQPRKFVPSVPALRPTHVTSTIPNVAYAVVEGPARCEGQVSCKLRHPLVAQRDVAAPCRRCHVQRKLPQPWWVEHRCCLTRWLQAPGERPEKQFPQFSAIKQTWLGFITCPVFDPPGTQPPTLPNARHCTSI